LFIEAMFVFSLWLGFRSGLEKVQDAGKNGLTKMRGRKCR
jgi:hypothetical protein